jgi:hypothetical protein
MAHLALGPARRGKAGGTLVNITERREESLKEARALSRFTHNTTGQRGEPGDRILGGRHHGNLL